MKPVSLPLGQTALGRGGRGSIEEAFLLMKSLCGRPQLPLQWDSIALILLAFVNVGDGQWEGTSAETLSSQTV